MTTQLNWHANSAEEAGRYEWAVVPEGNDRAYTLDVRKEGEGVAWKVIYTAPSPIRDAVDHNTLASGLAADWVSAKELAEKMVLSIRGLEHF